MANVRDARSQLMDDFNKIATDTESLLREVASVPGEKASALRAAVQENLADARQRVRELQGIAYERGSAAFKATDEYARENTWALIGAAAAVGFVVGFSLRRD